MNDTTTNLGSRIAEFKVEKKWFLIWFLAGLLFYILVYFQIFSQFNIYGFVIISLLTYVYPLYVLLRRYPTLVAFENGFKYREWRRDFESSYQDVVAIDFDRYTTPVLNNDGGGSMYPLTDAGKFRIITKHNKTSRLLDDMSADVDGKKISCTEFFETKTGLKRGFGQYRA